MRPSLAYRNRAQRARHLGQQPEADASDPEQATSVFKVPRRSGCSSGRSRGAGRGGGRKGGAHAASLCREMLRDPELRPR